MLSNREGSLRKNFRLGIEARNKPDTEHRLGVPTYSDSDSDSDSENISVDRLEVELLELISAAPSRLR